jgi:MFS family permease
MGKNGGGHSVENRDKIILGVASNIIFLGIVSFFTDISTELVVAVLPTFLVIQMGVSPEIVTGIEGAAESVTSFLRLISGAIADKTGKRKKLVVLGYGLSNAVKPLIAFATTWPQVLLLRVSDRVGKGIRTPPRDAIIADSTEEKVMGRAFGIHRTLDQLGAIVGPVLAFLLLIPLGYYWIFLFTAIPGVIAVSVLLKYVKEPPSKQSATKFTLKGARGLLKGAFSMYLGSATLYSIAAFSYALVLLRGVNVGIPPIFSPLIYAGIQVFHVLVSLPAGHLSDRFGRVRAIQLGYLLLFASFIVIALSSSPWMLILGAFLFGANQGVVETTQRAIVPSMVPAEFKGTAYGLYNMMIGIVTLPTNLVAGFLFQIDNSYAFYYGAFFAVLASLAMVLTQRRMEKEAPKSH